MATIKDGEKSYNAFVNKVTASTVTVTMTTEEGYNAVTGGADRAGQAIDGDKTYDVKLPGLKAGPPLVVSLTQAIAGKE